MNKLLILPLLLCFRLAIAQEGIIPRTPSKIEFANVIVNIDRQIQPEIDNIVRDLLMPENSFLDAKLERMQWYFPIIEKILKEEKVPDDLKYLAVQESNLYPDALSSSGAVGFWQFKSPTASDLGLVMNSEIDERKYIFASTKAAAVYFKKNNLIYKNWVSCIYAYYQGPSGALKDIPSNWAYATEITFDKKTPEYLLKALANRIAYEHRLNRIKPSSKKLLVYPAEGKTLTEISTEMNVDLSELRNYNVWAANNIIPSGKIYNVLIPVESEQASKTLAWVKEIANQKPSSNTSFPALYRTTKVTTSDEDPIFYTINGKRGILAKPGNEAAQLALKSGIKLTNFLKYNDLSDREMIKTGSIYYLEKKDKKASTPFHTASANQTYWDISQIYGVRLIKLLKYNRLRSTIPLKAGQVVWLQRKRPRNEKVLIKPTTDIENTPQLPVIIDDNKDKQEERPSLQPSEKQEIAQNTPEPTLNKIEQSRDQATNVYDDIPEAHQVKSGETLYSISKKYDIPVGTLRELNGLSVNSVLRYGQILILKGEPIKTVTENFEEEEEEPTTRPYTPSTSSPRNNGSASYHTVKAGQTLYSISKMYDITVADIQNWNDLDGTIIEIGQRLKVSQGGGAIPTRPAAATTYTVQRGDTLFSISQRYNVTVRQLQIWNNLNNNNISVGQKLKVN